LNPPISRILLCLFSVLTASFALGQSNIIFDNYSFELKKHAAINSAKRYLENKFSNKEISQHFVADSTSSIVVCDGYKTFFSPPLFCPAVGFEIAFHVALNCQGSSARFRSHLFLPVDSSLNVLADSLDDVWRRGFLEAWEKLITNKYKVNCKREKLR
jgi:hypothetical protein